MANRSKRISKAWPPPETKGRSQILLNTKSCCKPRSKVLSSLDLNLQDPEGFWVPIHQVLPIQGTIHNVTIEEVSILLGWPTIFKENPQDIFQLPMCVSDNHQLTVIINVQLKNLGGSNQRTALWILMTP